MANSKKTIFLEKGVAWRKENGKRVPVDSIEASANNECSKVDFCDNSIKYISPSTGNLVTIPLDDIATTLGII